MEKKKNFNSYPMPIKINSKHITDLKIKPKTIKLMGKNKWKICVTLNYERFLRTQNTWATKKRTDKLNFMKIKLLKLRKKVTDKEKILANYKSIKEPIFKICEKDVSQLRKKTLPNFLLMGKRFKNMLYQRYMNRKMLHEKIVNIINH